MLLTSFPQYAIGFSVLATLALAFAAFLTIKEANAREARRRKEEIEREKRDRKERLLNEILDWATDIQKTSLDINIPVTGGLLSKAEERRRIEANILLRYGISFSKNEYARAIVDKTFKKELQSDVENAIKTFTAFYFLKGKSFGLENPKQAFRGTALEIIEEVEKQMGKEKKTAEQFLSGYSEQLAYSMNGLMIKIGNIKANL